MQQNLLAAAVAGIVVVGGGAGYVVGSSDLVDVTGGGTVHLPDATATYHACPGTGHLGQLHRGDRVLLTGVDEHGDWYELRSPVDLLDRVWVRAAVVTPDDDTVADLPERTCGLTDEELTVAADPAGPEDPDQPEEPEGDETTTTTAENPDPETPTTAGPPATAAPGQPTAPTTRPRPPTTSSPATTRAPDRIGPSVTGFARSAPLLKEASGEFCDAGLPTSTEVAVTVTDPSGVGSVTLHWDRPDQQGRTQVPMVRQGTTYRAVLGPFSGGTVGASGAEVDLGWTVRAVDGVGNPRTVTAPAAAAVELVGC